MAVDAGIVSQNDINVEGIALTGEEFRRKIGNFQIVYDQLGQERIKFQNEDAFRKVHHKVRVIARAGPRDKQILIRGMKSNNGMIGMAGDSIADSAALIDADVGFCMGTGCDVAKDNSDLIIIDNDFSSIYKSIKWGKAMFDNSRKFIVFQFTVSISMLVTCFLSAITLGNLPFNVIQMLWINLVMDILAAISLGTGCDSIKKGRISRKEKVFEASMWRQIMVQACYQILVNVVLMYAGGAMLGQPYNLVTTNPRNEGKVLTDTFLFHTFFMMTMFNQINARIVDKDEINMFKTLQSNIIFWIIWIAEMAVQHFMLFWSANSITGAAILGMSPISVGIQVIAVAIGAFSFVIHVFHVKFIPIDGFITIDDKIGIEAEAGNAAASIDNIFSVAKSRMVGTAGDDDSDDNYFAYKEDGVGEAHMTPQNIQPRAASGSQKK